MAGPFITELPIDHRLLAGAWCAATAWGSVLTVAQAPAAAVAADTAHWTAFGLLTSVLVAVGAFLKWYLPHREQAHERMLAEQRTDFAAMLTEQREATAQLLADEREHHRTVLELIRPDATDSRARPGGGSGPGDFGPPSPRLAKPDRPAGPLSG